MTKDDLVYRVCLGVVQHIRTLLKSHESGFNSDNKYGFNTRIFSHMLHPEMEFVYGGESPEVEKEGGWHPEHVVPCRVLIDECCRLIDSGSDDDHIAKLLQKHWKVTKIAKSQAKKLDFEFGLKSKMPQGWCFETGDTYARLNLAGIKLNHV